MNLTLAAMALMILSTAAHLEINLVAGDYAQLSNNAASIAGSDKTISSRTSIATGTLEGSAPNKPNVGDTCHGELMLTGDRLATLTAGGEVTWGILEKNLGSGHDGGHCSWWVSTGVDQIVWYKFADGIDCTNNAYAGDQPDTVKIPTNLPLACAEACTLMWLWAPLHSASCEIYSNCFDVKIEGVEGGIEDDYPMIKAPFTCIRPNTESHKTSSFGRFINVDDGGDITLEKVVDGDPNCYQYTVREGDELAAIRAKFDISAEELHSKNLGVMANEDVLAPAGTKLIITGCGTDPQFIVVVSAGSKYMPVLTVLGALVVSLF